jgi:hypothetical protein
MNYVEIVAKQEELTKELNELQQARIASAQSHENIEVEKEIGDIVASLTVAYENDDVCIEIQQGESTVTISVEQYNQINEFLGKYSDAVFSFYSHKEAEAGEEAK